MDTKNPSSGRMRAARLASAANKEALSGALYSTPKRSARLRALSHSAVYLAWC